MRISSTDGFELCIKSADAETIMPGMQWPHCTAPSSRKASWIGFSLPSFTNPSDVIISEPCACETRTRQEQTGWPFIRTVQAPHSPFAQSSFGPVTCRFSRRTSSKVYAGGHLRVTRCPLSLKFTVFSIRKAVYPTIANFHNLRMLNASMRVTLNH